MTYIGDFKDDVREGKGILKQEQAPFVKYEGEFKDDKRHGKVQEMTYGGNPEEPGNEPDVVFKMG